MRVEQISSEQLLEHIKEPDIYMITFSEKQNKPTITKITSAKLGEIFAADCYVRFIKDEA